ncbi:hypothetical protein D3C75_701970 [compost metagenome]
MRACASTASGSAPVRSILLTKISVGIPSLRSGFQIISLCACTPSTADRISTAQSITRRLRSTSDRKSTCPGVSTRFTSTPFQVKEASAARTEIPRCRSTSIESVTAVPLSTLPKARMRPLSYNICSVVVVFPASTWAKIPIFIRSVRCC